MRPAERIWITSMATSVAITVAFAVLLIAVADGARDEVIGKIGDSLARQYQVDDILSVLTVVITLGMAVQTALVTFVLGAISMRGRREEIALRRQSGVFRSRLMGEFLRVVLLACLLGGIVGEIAGAGAATLLASYSALQPKLTLAALVTAFPVTVAIAVIATLIPAWRAASASPALLRKE